MNQFWVTFRTEVRSALRRAVLRWRTRNLGLRPVMRNIHGQYALTRDGEVVLLSDPPFRAYELPLHPVPVSGHMQRIVYILAAEQDPALARLIPARGPDDVTCPDCGGSGRMIHPDKDLIEQGHTCWCAGAGWLPDGMGPFEFH